MTPAQRIEWFTAAYEKLEVLKGPFDFWSQATPMLVRFCDGHGVHLLDLKELRLALFEARDRLLSPKGEDGPACGVSAQQAFVEICAIIANAKRVSKEEPNEEDFCDS